MLMKLTAADKSETFLNIVWINTDSVQMVCSLKTDEDNKTTTRIVFREDNTIIDVLEPPEYIADFFPGNATRPKGS